jgi:hypothetical protein
MMKTARISFRGGFLHGAWSMGHGVCGKGKNLTTEFSEF